MRRITLDTSKDPLTSDILLAVQLRSVHGPWLPRLESFECEGVTGAFIPFVPLFLSSKTTQVTIGFAEDSPAVAIATLITKFPTLCPDLYFVALSDLPKDLVIIEAVSEVLLACNRDTLRVFCADCPLTEEAREVVYRLPRLDQLWTAVQGPTSLPTVTLPNLSQMRIDFYDDLNWLQGFRGATLGKLESVVFRAEANHMGDFLGAFERVALSASAQNTLSEFKIYAILSWNPNYSALLSFNQLKEVEIVSPCEGGCSSRVDDDIVVNLARAMPKLEVLQLGGTSCGTPTGITVNGLINLACRCPHLSALCIHLRADTLVEAAASATAQSRFDEPDSRREDCALTDLHVGKAPIPARSELTVALVLLQIFPRMLNVKYTNDEWQTVAETVKDFGRIRGFVHHSSKTLIIIND